MLKIMTQCMNLNGDEKYSDDDGMNSTFGCSTFDGWIGVLSTTAGSLVRLDNDDMPYFAGADEKFYDAIDKLTEVFSGDGRTAGTSINYDKFFMSGRAAFCVISIGNAHIFRGMTDRSGILPAPKFDTSDNYKSMMGSAIMFSIPSTSRNAEKTGAAYDALSYYSYRDVMPVYYSSLCYKGLRDDDSVDMLEHHFRVPRRRPRKGLWLVIRFSELLSAETFSKARRTPASSTRKSKKQDHR